PPESEVVLALPRHVHGGSAGGLRFEREGSRRWVDQAISALAPRFVILRTGTDLSTSSRDRSLLARFVEEVSQKGPRVLWEPRGLWEPEEAQRYAEAIGCEIAVDLLKPSTRSPVEELLSGQEQEGPARSLLYGRVESLGFHARLGEEHLRRAVDEARSLRAEDTWIVVQANDPIRKVRRLLELFHAPETPLPSSLADTIPKRALALALAEKAAGSPAFASSEYGEEEAEDEEEAFEEDSFEEEEDEGDEEFESWEDEDEFDELDDDELDED
ncbi:MAG: hypothetical protein NZM37_12745, partial [Sandaracinaceae bacterium]|nr:hypothetical protein [Sandaracinaceae bacterium]